MLALFLPFLVVLGGCRSEATLDVTDGDQQTLTFDIDSEIGSNDGTMCEKAKTQLEAQRSVLGESTTAPVPGAKGASCRITLKLSSSLKQLLYSKSGDKVTAEIPGQFWSSFNSAFAGKSGISQSDLESANFSITFKLPGKVTKASDGGRIDGNKVTWTDYKIVSKGIKAESDSSASDDSATGDDDSTSSDPGDDDSTAPSKSSKTDSPAADAKDESDDGGFPMWGWIAIGAGAIVVVGLIAFLLTRRKGDDTGFPGPGYPGGVPPVGPQYGQPDGSFGQPDGSFGQPAPYDQQAQGFQGYGQPPAGYGQQNAMPGQQFQNPGQQFQNPGQQFQNPGNNPQNPMYP